MQPLFLERFEPLVTCRIDFGLDPVDFAVHGVVLFGEPGEVRIAGLEPVDRIGIIREGIVEFVGGVRGIWS